jgi:hypothetical protein
MLQSSSLSTCSAVEAEAPFSFGTTHAGAVGRGPTVSVADALLFAEFVSAMVVATETPFV